MITQAQKEANQKVADMRQEITDMPKENISAAGLVAEYEQLENKTSKSVEDTQRMLDIRAELVEQYGFSAMAIDEEGRLLAGNLEIMKEQLAINRLALLDKMEEDKPKSNEEFNDKIKERKKLIKQLKEEEDNLSAEKSEAEFLPPGISEGRQNEIQRIIDNLKEEIQEIDAQLEPIIRSTMRRIVMTAQSEGKTIPEELQGLIADILRESLATGLTLEEGEIKADEAIVKFLAIDAGVILENLSPGLQELKNGLIAALLTDEDIDVDTAQNFVNSILGDIIGEGDNAEVFEKFAEAKQQLLGGNDSDENLKQYDQARQEILDRFNREIEQANRDMALGVPGLKGDTICSLRRKKVI